MSARRIAVALAGMGVLGVALATPLLAQGLGDLAARERSKRAGQKDGKVFTNDDLEKGRPPGHKGDSGGATPAPPEESGSASSEPVVDRTALERPYLDAIAAAEAGVTSAQARVRALSDKVNPMSLSYIYGASGSNDANEELRVRAELRQAEVELEAARQEVVTAQKTLQEFRLGRLPSPE